jgi:hypothetical protein
VKQVELGTLSWLASADLCPVTPHYTITRRVVFSSNLTFIVAKTGPTSQHPSTWNFWSPQYTPWELPFSVVIHRCEINVPHGIKPFILYGLPETPSRKLTLSHADTKSYTMEQM